MSSDRRGGGTIQQAERVRVGVLTGQNEPTERERALETEYLNGRMIGPDELDTIKRELDAMEQIEVISDDLRAIVMRRWPHLESKLPPQT